MKKLESAIIKTIIWSVVPFICFILFWWISAFLNIYQFIRIADTIIAISAFTGLIFGFGLVIIYHKYFYNEFYKFPYKFLIPLYLFLSSVAFAFLMGVPLCIIILGIIAGLYIGRRALYREERQSNIFRRISLFTSLVTCFWVFIIFMFARGEDQIIDFIEGFTGLNKITILGPIGFALIVLITVLFGFLQFYLTFFASKLSYKFGY